MPVRRGPNHIHRGNPGRPRTAAEAAYGLQAGPGPRAGRKARAGPGPERARAGAARTVPGRAARTAGPGGPNGPGPGGPNGPGRAARTARVTLQRQVTVVAAPGPYREPELFTEVARCGLRVRPGSRRVCPGYAVALPGDLTRCRAAGLVRQRNWPGTWLAEAGRAGPRPGPGIGGPAGVAPGRPRDDRPGRPGPGGPVRWPGTGPGHRPGH